ncbi:MAG: purine-nucleoside phosphorylase [Myxococcota bacterium]
MEDTTTAQLTHIDQAAKHILAASSCRPWLGLILGSGLGSLADAVEQADRFPYDTIPGFPQTTVEGHAGQLVLGQLEGAPVIVMQGRFHAYEGHPNRVVTFPVRVMRQLGVRLLLVTNSAGGVDTGLEPGDLMLIEDQLNLTGANPLMGSNLSTIGPRFPDMTFAYDPDLRARLLAAAQELGIPLKRGVYAGVLGPSYETPAEVRMIRTLGGSAVGMSTVPEVIVAVHAGLRVAGLSCISNVAAGVTDDPINHDDVGVVAGQATAHLTQLVRRFIASLSADPNLDTAPLPGALTLRGSTV